MTPDEYVGYFQYRVLQDAFNEATSAYWLRRAESFEWAKPRIDDFHGRSGNDDLSKQWRRADETAQACRNRASVALMGDEDPELVFAALCERWGVTPPWQQHEVIPLAS